MRGVTSSLKPWKSAQSMAGFRAILEATASRTFDYCHQGQSLSSCSVSRVGARGTDLALFAQIAAKYDVIWGVKGPATCWAVHSTPSLGSPSLCSTCSLSYYPHDQASCSWSWPSDCQGCDARCREPILLQPSTKRPLSRDLVDWASARGTAYHCDLEKLVRYYPSCKVQSTKSCPGVKHPLRATTVSYLTFDNSYFSFLFENWS